MRQNLAFMDRFRVVQVGYPEPAVEKEIIKTQVPRLPDLIAEKMITVAGEIRRLFVGAKEGGAELTVTMSTRTLVRWAGLSLTFKGGSAKEWGYAEMGTGSGLFEVRWGKAGQLVQHQVGLTRAIIHQRRDEKMNKGYQPVGRRLIDAHGAVSPLPRIQPASERPPAPSPSSKKPRKSAIDIAALLGGDEDGFYF